MRSTLVVHSVKKKTMNEYHIKIERWAETTSTNDILRAYPTPSAKAMTIVVADFQTAGRGQAGNVWESERGKNMLFSILTHPEGVAVADQYVLSMAGALALKAVLDTYTDAITLKWPNDIYWRDRKISGTLIETTVKGNTLERCIFGIGLNINQREFRSNAPNPVSLYNIIGEETSLSDVLNAVIERFTERYAQAVRGDTLGITTDYNASLFRRHGFYWYEDCATGERFEATISHVEANGQLHLRDKNHNERAYWMKEVRFLL